MTETPQTVGDLDPDRQIWVAVNQRISGVHLDPDCRGIDEPQRQVAAATRWDDTDICSYCNGTYNSNIPDNQRVPADPGVGADD